MAPFFRLLSAAGIEPEMDKYKLVRCAGRT